jgi:hypothetical protein
MTLGNMRDFVGSVLTPIIGCWTPTAPFAPTRDEIQLIHDFIKTHRRNANIGNRFLEAALASRRNQSWRKRRN